MKLAAMAIAIANAVPPESLSGDYIVPSVFDEYAAPAVQPLPAQQPGRKRERGSQALEPEEQKAGIFTALLF